MNKTTHPQQLEETARLINQCPVWCTETHDPNTHPEDVAHRRRVGQTEWGEIILNLWPIKVGNSPNAELYLEGIGISLSFDQAQSLSGTLHRAVDALRMATFGRDDRVAEVTA